MIVKPITTNNAITGPPTNPTAGDPLFVYNLENPHRKVQVDIYSTDMII